MGVPGSVCTEPYAQVFELFAEFNVPSIEKLKTLRSPVRLLVAVATVLSPLYTMDQSFK